MEERKQKDVSGNKKVFSGTTKVRADRGLKKTWSNIPVLQTGILSVRAGN